MFEFFTYKEGLVLIRRNLFCAISSFVMCTFAVIPDEVEAYVIEGGTQVSKSLRFCLKRHVIFLTTMTPKYLTFRFQSILELLNSKSY